MTTPNIHLIIVTDRAQANLIPILQFKPDYVALAISDDKTKHAESFIKLLKKVGQYQDHQILQFKQVPSVGLENIQIRAMEIEEQLKQQFPNATITYNATGGTKLMVLGFYDVFHQQGNSIHYTDTQHQQIEVVFPEKTTPIAIGNVLNIESYLLSMDKQYRKHASADWEAEVKQRRALTIWLAQNNEKLHVYWSVINSLAHNALAADKRGQAPSIANPLQTFHKNLPFKLWQTALKKCHDAGLCQWDANQMDSLYFHNVAGAKYLSGGWLEEYIWLTASELNCEQVWANVEFTEAQNPKDDVRNEMDCLILHNNRLLIIECKTSVFKADNGKGADILYRLSTMAQRTGGLFGNAWLVSARELDEDSFNRAREYRIPSVQAGDIANMRSKIQQWMQGNDY